MIGRKLSAAEANKIIFERIPLDRRMAATYHPIIVMDCACYIADSLFALLKEKRIRTTLPYTRRLKAEINKYRSENRVVMHSDLYADFSQHTIDIYKWMYNDILIYQQSYIQEVLKRGIRTTNEMKTTIAQLYIIRTLTQYVIALDRKFSQEMSDILGKQIHYTTEDNKRCLGIIKAANEMLSFLNIPLDLHSEFTDRSYKVLKNKVSRIKFEYDTDRHCHTDGVTDNSNTTDCDSPNAPKNDRCEG